MFFFVFLVVATTRELVLLSFLVFLISLDLFHPKNHAHYYATSRLDEAGVSALHVAVSDRR